MDSMQEGTLEDNLEFEKRLEKLRKQGEVVHIMLPHSLLEMSISLLCLCPSIMEYKSR